MIKYVYCAFGICPVSSSLVAIVVLAASEADAPRQADAQFNCYQCHGMIFEHECDIWFLI